MVMQSGAAGMVRRGLGGAGLMLVPFLLAACTASPSALAPQAATQTQAKPAEPQPTPAELSEHQRILAVYGGVYTDPRLQAMIQQLVERLVAASDRPDLHYKVTILDSPTVNAFALPDGELYVTRGLLALANDESELASVIGHEMGHVIARHAELREQEIRDEELGDRVFTDLVNDPQAGALALAKSKLKIAGFSQKQELQADAIGIAITAHAGLDPYGAARFLASLQRNSELRLRKGQAGAIKSAAPDFLASHPTTPERIADALATARQYKAPATDTPLARAQARAAYLADLDGMLYGEDESAGFVRGRRFMHPQLGFTFTAPEGFALDNTAKAVLGVTRHGKEALRFDVVSVPAEQALAAYLTSGWIENTDPKSVQPLTVNGFAAATARAKSDNWNFRLYAIRFGSDVYRFIFAAKKSTAETDRLFRQSVDTFRRMTLAEIRQVKPLRVRVVTVKPGDMIEKLAEQMETPDRRVERFLVLNGLDPGDKLQPGSEVKIVAH
jgi:predicted Zn-dependent protease